MFYLTEFIYIYFGMPLLCIHILWDLILLFVLNHIDSDFIFIFTADGPHSLKHCFLASWVITCSDLEFLTIRLLSWLAYHLCLIPVSLNETVLGWSVTCGSAPCSLTYIYNMLLLFYWICLSSMFLHCSDENPDPCLFFYLKSGNKFTLCVFSSVLDFLKA